MNDNQKAASILRQYAGELYQGHTIGGEWDGEHIKAEHDELIALADRLALADAGEPVADSGKMWSLVRSRVQGIHSRLSECNTSAEFNAALDSYSNVLVEELIEKFAAHPAPDRVADDATLERIIDASAGEWHDDEFRINGSDLMQMLRAVSRLWPAPDRVAELEAQCNHLASALADAKEFEQAYREECMADISILMGKLAESRERVARAYGLLWHVNAGIDAPWGTPSLTPERAAMESRKVLRDMLTSEQRGDGINAARDIMKALAADKEGE